MSQRGGSVTSDVRFGDAVLSPMVSEGEADYLVVLGADQVEPNRLLLCEDGDVIHPSLVDEKSLPSRKCLNVALLGILSRSLDFPLNVWHEAIRANLPERLHQANLKAFEIGRNS